ncbi:MAG: restriction endonuclease subunit S [Methylobacter sp.]
MKRGWEAKLLGEVIRLEYGKPLDSTDRNPNGRYPAYGANGEKDRTDKFFRDKPSIIVGRKGSAGEITLTEDKFWPLDVTYFVEFDRERYDLQFLYYLLSTLDLPSLAKGVKPGINRNEVYALPVRIPLLPEQHRIVAILDEAFDGIATAKANAEKNLQNARALFESHLQAVFSQRSEGWVEKSVEELVSEGILLKPFDGNHGEIHPRKSDYTSTGIPFIMASDIQNGEVDTEHCKFISRKLADSLRVGFAKDGDVLISHKGTIGRSAVVNTELDYIMLTPQVTSYRVLDKTRLSNRFIRYYFMSPSFQSEIARGAEDGATRAYIGITKQLGLSFRYPSLLGEQCRIVEKLNSLAPETQRLESIYRQKIAALDELKKSLLHQAFSGEL